MKERTMSKYVDPTTNKLYKTTAKSYNDEHIEIPVDIHVSSNASSQRAQRIKQMYMECGIPEANIIMRM